MNSGVTLIIPTMNEVQGMKWFMPQLQKEWYDELIVTDSGSTDGTIEYCRENGYPIHVLTEKGLTIALVEALKHSTKDIVITLSPDGNSLPELIPQLVKKMNEGYDMVIVSRYAGSARSLDDDRWTGIGNRFFTKLINFLFGSDYSDALVMYRAYRREAMLKMGLDRQLEENWLTKKYYLLSSWELASCARAAKLKLKVSEIPGDEPKRIGGNRKLSIVIHGTAALLQVFYECLTGKMYLREK